MRIEILKTYEISDDIWEKIAEGFIESFHVETTAERMKNAFCVRNPLGYGYHAVAFTEDGDVAGYNVFSPTFYNDGIKAVVSGSTYVRPKYRNNEMLFLDMIKALRKCAVENGFHVDVGVPNHNSRNFSAKVLKTKYVGDLDYYVLPYCISKCINKPYLKILDPFAKGILHCHLWLQSFWTALSNAREKKVKYEMLTTSENLHARFKGSYQHICKGNMEAYYRVTDEDGKKAIYLMDFREQGERTSKSLNYAVSTIVKNEHPDAVLFVGWLRLKQLTLFKVPKNKVPKPLPLVFYVLDKNYKDQFADMEDANNWNFSLMNFDVR